MAYAMASKVRPKASDTPRKPIPKFGKAAASTALPQPPKTSPNVPRNSARALFLSGTDTSSFTCQPTAFTCQPTARADVHTRQPANGCCLADPISNSATNRVVQEQDDDRADHRH